MSNKKQKQAPPLQDIEDANDAIFDQVATQQHKEETLSLYVVSVHGVRIRKDPNPTNAHANQNVVLGNHKIKAFNEAEALGYAIKAHIRKCPPGFAIDQFIVTKI